MNENFNIKKLKKELTVLNNKRTEYIFNLVHGKSLLYGMPIEVYRQCGKKNCKCSRGEKHGPYPALSINSNGRQKIIMINKSSKDIILKKSKRYKYFQHTLARIRKINKEIDNILKQIKVLTIEYYM